MSPIQNFLLVELEPGLDVSRSNGIVHGIRVTFPGVVSVTDLTAVTQATLDAILMKPTAALKRTNPSTYNAIRQYHRRQLQPELANIRKP